MSRRFISLLLFVIMLILSVTSTGAFADSYFQDSIFMEWKEVYLVEPFKEWTILFNEEVDKDSVNNSNIFVENHLGEIVDTNAIIGDDGKTVIVEPPLDGYSTEYDYTLFIEDILSKDGEKLKENIKMKFFIEDGTTKDEIEYQEDIVKIEGATIYDEYTEDIKTIIINLDQFEEKNLQEGSIIMTNPSTEDIYGYVGKIVSYRVDGENVIVETIEPSLEEVFTSIDIKGQQDISIEQMINIQLREGIRAKGYREFNRETREYTEGVEYIFGTMDGDIANVGVEYGDFIIKGSIRVENPKIDFDIKTSFFNGFERFYLAYNADIVSDLEIKYNESFSGDLDENITLFSYPVPLGPTGLIADFKLDVYADGDINASGRIEAKISQTTKVTLGARKARNGNMEWIRNTTKESPEFTSHITTEFSANAEVGISPSIELSFFKVVSADLQGKIGPYLKLNARAEGEGNFIDGYFNGRLHTEVGVAFSSAINLGDAWGIIGKTYSLGRAEIKIWSYTKKYNAETYGELQYIKFPVETLDMKVNEQKKLEVIGVYRNTITGNEFESLIKDGVEFHVSPSGCTNIDSKGNIRIISGENKEITVTARYKGKETSIVIYVEVEQVEEPIDIINYIMISSGYNHTVVLKKDGTVWSWGSNLFGTLGDGTEEDSKTPVQVKGLNNVKSISVGGDHSIVLKNDGTVWSWGYNYFGELGDGTNENRNVPVQVKGINNVKSIFTSDTHSLALKEDGTVWSWGNNYDGQLGDGTNENKNIPVQVVGLNNVIAISAGSAHSVALRNDGTVWSWGENFRGALGDGTNENSCVPVQVKGLKNVVSISAGGIYTTVLKEDGTVWFWGNNSGGLVQVEGLTNVISISAGDTHRIALKSDGTVWSWGNNNCGQLGDGTNEGTYNRPVQVKKLNNVISIGTGNYNSFAIKEDGTVWGWGTNLFGALGDGTTDDSNIPIQALIMLW